ncbi:MAG: DUF2911 domain-containing protein [Gemmatimonadetes bacterium]|nr:DUF2911 domain-containing protein [Gemmatimonadota bacterium]NIQ56458.1 DUF2911 domain-containing protein [Gemmatimonadota bacterium]NIU76647.1 DUF2911 domain-containing protein [Gammaproteobacteria bacterium]NIX46087.1 DUF2911 domain-containing protein [Gemmatimonadota bacterium]NIY10410.1 DUF2911 domain-containing protein [Gemmatimonadota bacterium]
MRHPTLAAAVAATTLATVPVPATAQIRASESGRVAQTVDGTTLEIAYSRPSARGRALFGELVPWDVVWTPGANWATTLETDRDIRLNGVAVPAGKYTVWMIPREGPWTLTLNPNPKLFHFQKPDSTDEQIHVAVEPEPAPHREMLTWSFPAVSGDGAVLEMAWGETRIPVGVVVQPTRPVTLTAEERAPYLGHYAMKMVEGIGWPEDGPLEVFEKDGMLRARWPFPFHPGDELEFDLVPAGPDRFSAGLYRDGELFNVEPGGTFEFDVDDDGSSTYVRLRGIEGSVFGQGPRSDAPGG